VLGSAVLVYFAAVKKDNETLSSGFWLAVISDVLALVIGIYDIIITCCKYRNTA
jgi:mannose/fructose/N-acetylgalactosamine-specific phosphotransferase system component IIC